MNVLTGQQKSKYKMLFRLRSQLQLTWQTKMHAGVSKLAKYEILNIYDSSALFDIQHKVMMMIQPHLNTS